MRPLRLSIIDEHGGSSLTPDLVERLRCAMMDDTTSRLVTLEGGRTAFCTGMNLGVLSAEELDRPTLQSQEALGRFGRLLDLISRDPRPVIALIDGPVIGGGIGLAAAADYVLASGKATFSLSEAFLGLIPATIFPFLARRIGIPRARWLALGAASLSPQEALAFGLVDRISDDLTGALERIARRILRADPRAIAEIKALIDSHYGVTEHYRSDAARRFARLLASPETQARLARFGEGGTPWPELPGEAAP
jgi:polyketide biosynthesis enoyl-CoA hydratase PksH